MRIGAPATWALLCWCSLAGAAPVPPWARELAASRESSEAAALVLLDHLDVTVTSDGKLRTTRRYAVRVRDRAGRDAAAIREVYVTGTERVKEIRGWLIRADGTVRELGSRDTIDAALVNNDIYNDVRVRRMGVVDEVAPGDVFAAETESEGQLLFSQLEWSMQDRWPTVVSRRTLTLPTGWRAIGVIFNAPPLEPRREGGALVWEMKNLRALPDEAAMPPATDLTPRVAVSFFGPDPRNAPGQFATWRDVSAWLHAAADASSRPSATVTAKAREVTATAATDVERIAAIAGYVQRVQYISIQTGIGRGGGYQPRPAPLVLERNYGDCKDKASLMRAMLSSIGITSHLVTIFSGDRNYVRAEWPSPQQFNHAIIAVFVGTVRDVGTSIVEHPDLGRLVIFDPTDEHTPFGELPLDEQGSLGLIVHPSGGTLVRVPLAPASRHAVDRLTEGVIGPDGALMATIQERFSGAPAADARRRHAMLDETSHRASIERRLAAALPRVRARRIQVREEGARRTFALTIDIEATGYAQSEGRLLLVAAPFELGGRPLVPAAAGRRTAVLLDPSFVTETVRLGLPTGYVVDEKPTRVALDTPFGRYTLEYSTEDQHLVAKRSLEVPLQTIKAEQVAAARAFFDQVRAADSGLVVLARREYMWQEQE